MVFVRAVLLIAVLLLGWVALRGGLHPAVAFPAPPPLPAVAAAPAQEAPQAQPAP